MHTSDALSPFDRDFLHAAYEAERGRLRMSVFEIGKKAFPEEDPSRPERALNSFLKCKAKGWLLGPVDEIWVTREGKRIVASTVAQLGGVPSSVFALS